MTLTEFLLARIAEDEDEAHHLPHPPTSSALPAGACFECGTNILAECEAKRQIVAAHTIDDHDAADPDGALPDCPDCWQSWPCCTLRLMGTVYVDHPDYQPEWKP